MDFLRSLNLIKFKIQQSIPSDCNNSGHYAIVRSAALNDSINILRRFGEGSRPLFERDDITVNQPSVGDSHGNTSGYDRNDFCKAKQNLQSLSTESSSPERYRHRDSKKHSSPPSVRCKSPERSHRDEKPVHDHKHSQGTKYSSYTKTERSRRRERSRSRTLSPAKKNKPMEKLPYYRDEQRERDRKRRLYERSRSPLPRRHVDISSRRRSSSRERYRRYLLHHSSKEEHKNRRSRSLSNSRSPSINDRDGRKHSSREQNKDSNALTTTVIASPPQIIPIAVSVPANFGYPFAGWAAPQASWDTGQHPPTTVPHYASIPMLPMMPPLRPPHQNSFAGLLPPLHIN